MQDKRPKPDASVIERAPLESGSQTIPAAAENELSYLTMLGDMASRLESAEAENQRLKGEVSIEKVKAEMMKPYAGKVFWFVAFYCVGVGGLLLLQGFKTNGFTLPATVLDIIAGSTATSVLGLIGIIVSGLFGARK